MNNRLAVTAFMALSYDTRLRTVQLLIEAGDDGLPAGEIARRLKVPQNTLSTHLSALGNADLIRSERQGRSIIYRANSGQIEKVAQFLAAMTG